MSSQLAPPSTRAFDGDGFSWVIDEFVGNMPGEQCLSLRMLSFWVTWVCTLLVTGHEFAFHRLQTMRLSPGAHVNCFLAVNEILMLEVAGQSQLKTVCDPLLKIPS